MTSIRNGKGYVSDLHGYSVTYSWWQHTMLPGLWRIVGHSAFTCSGVAVIDDFGNLVEVQS